MNTSRLYMFFVFGIVLMLSISACAVKPSASSLTTELVPSVVPTETAIREPVLPTEGITVTPTPVQQYANRCDFIDSHVSYTLDIERENVQFLFACNQPASRVEFKMSDGRKIVGRVFADTYRPSQDESVEVQYYFDLLDSHDSTIVLDHLSTCLVSVGDAGLFYTSADDQSFFVDTEDKRIHVNMMCSVPISYADDPSVIVNFNIDPLMLALPMQPIFVGDIQAWSELGIGAEAMFCYPKIPGLTTLFPEGTIWTGGDWDIKSQYVRMRSCVPGTVLDPASGTIIYDGDHYGDEIVGSAYVLEPQIQGGYPFVALDDLQVGAQYGLCQTTKHAPRIWTDGDSYDFWKKAPCVFAIYQGIENSFQSARPLTKWIVNGNSYLLYDVDGGYISPSGQ